MAASLRSPLARVRGLGSAKDGVEHWWLQRLTAAANVILVLWFVVSVVSLVGADHKAAVAWLKAPVNAALAVLLIVSVFVHLTLGLQVVLEDYVAAKGKRLVALVAVKFAAAFLAAVAILSVLRVLFS